MIFTAI